MTAVPAAVMAKGGFPRSALTAMGGEAGDDTLQQDGLKKPSQVHAVVVG
jgi:hypothetical protein